MKSLDLDLIQSELLALSDLAVKKALLKNADEAEALFSTADTVSVSVRGLTVEARRGVASGLGIRVVVDGKIGFAAATGTDRKQIESVVEEAIAVARIRPADPDFRHLPDPVQCASRDGVIDSEVVNLSEDDALISVSELAKGPSAFDKRVKSFYGNLFVNRACFAISNSRGIEGASQTAYIKASARCTTEEEGKRKTGRDFLLSRKLVDFSNIGENAAKNSLKMLGARQLDRTGKITVIWENMSIGELLKLMLSAAADAENVIRGRSRFNEKIGEAVASENVTIIDDGQLREGIETSKIDGEGVPRRTIAIIQKGVLKRYVYSSYSAALRNEKSTGNTTRDWPEPFLQLPTTSMTNIVLEPGTKELDALVDEVSEGILVTDNLIGIDTSNPITGDFSAVSSNAYLVLKGEITHPLEPVSIAGNFFDSLKEVEQVGSDVRLLEEGRVPSAVLAGLTVSG
jgi:PmbA protein